MGTYLIDYRLPQDVAVDVITNRIHVSDLQHQFSHFERAHWIWEPCPATTPVALNLEKRFKLSIQVLTGTSRDLYVGKDFFFEETSDPAAWAIYGARLIGWPREDFPLRYSLPGDIEAILAALGVFTVKKLQHRFDKMLEEAQDRDSLYHDHWVQRIREELLPHLLPNLQRFYEAALAEDQIVVYWMH